jgi:dTDP-4-amino-4,6-dideoxygalactose transaminase
MAANYRLGEFQGAVPEHAVERLIAQTIPRDRNGQYLAARLRQIRGFIPTTPAATARHSFNLFLFRIFFWRRRSVRRARRPQGLAAEGIRCPAGIRFRCIGCRCSQQGLRPVSPGSRKKLNLARCIAELRAPVRGARGVVGASFPRLAEGKDDIVRAFAKVFEHAVF